jgi:hypothetical protein
MPILHWIGKDKVVSCDRERKDFKLNGFINHYPDFIAMTRSGNALLAESKSDDRDNGDSERKLALGKEWERLAAPSTSISWFFKRSRSRAPGRWRRRYGLSLSSNWSFRT